MAYDKQMFSNQVRCAMDISVYFDKIGYEAAARFMWKALDDMIALGSIQHDTLRDFVWKDKIELKRALERSFYEFYFPRPEANISNSKTSSEEVSE